MNILGVLGGVVVLLAGTGLLMVLIYLAGLESESARPNPTMYGIATAVWVIGLAMCLYQATNYYKSPEIPNARMKVVAIWTDVEGKPKVLVQWRGDGTDKPFDNEAAIEISRLNSETEIEIGNELFKPGNGRTVVIKKAP